MNNPYSVNLKCGIFQKTNLNIQYQKIPAFRTAQLHAKIMALVYLPIRVNVSRVTMAIHVPPNLAQTAHASQPMELLTEGKKSVLLNCLFEKHNLPRNKT